MLFEVGSGGGGSFAQICATPNRRVGEELLANMRDTQPKVRGGSRGERGSELEFVAYGDGVDVHVAVVVVLVVEDVSEAEFVDGGEGVIHSCSET